MNVIITIKPNTIIIHKGGINAGGDNYWKLSVNENEIEPKLDKKVNTTSLTGVVHGGIFQP
jgi:hypothetical protein